MQTLWADIGRRLRSDTRLWMPTVAAGILTYLFLRIHRSFNGAILLGVQQSMRTRSAMGGPAGLSPYAEPVTIAAGVLLNLITGFLVAATVVVAFFVTAQMVRSASGHAARAVPVTPRKVIRLSLLVMAVYVPTVAVSMALSLPLLLPPESRRILGMPYVSAVGGLLVSLVMGYFLGPLALRSVAGNEGSQQTRAEARRLSIACLVGQGLLFAAMDVLLRQSFHTVATLQMAGFMSSVLGCLPYVPMFVGLALLAESGALRAAEPGAEAPLLVADETGA